MRRQVRKGLQVNDFRPRLLTENAQDTANTEPQISVDDRLHGHRMKRPPWNAQAPPYRPCRGLIRVGATLPRPVRKGLQINDYQP